MGRDSHCRATREELSPVSRQGSRVSTLGSRSNMDEAGLDRDRASEPVVVADDGGRGNVRGTGDSGAGQRGSAEFSMVPLGWLSAGAGTVAILLYAVQQALRLPSGFGVEDVLGWSTPAVVSVAVLNWCLPSAERWHAAAAYVLVDTAFFMPLYGALVIAAARAMAAALQTGPALKARVLQAGLLPVTTLLLILLWACDALENFGGAERLGLPAWAFFLALTVAARLFAIFLLTLLADRVEQSRRVCSNVGELAVAIIAIAAVVLTLNGQAACEAARQGFAGSFGFAWAHRLKPGAIVLALLPVAIAAVVWWFGIDLDLDDPGQNKLAGARAAWR